MSSMRTQVSLTREQREGVDQLAHREHVTVAKIIRRAVDAHLETERADPSAALSATFGTIPAETPSRDEWDRV